MTGKFITFEGVEGCGKSTQIRLIAEHLRSQGYELVLTREPGGTVVGERIRSVLLDSAHKGIAPITELLLYAAARNQHVEEVLLPALKAGKLVLCDRYADATTAYQGAARNIDPTIIKDIHRIATEGLNPDFTVLLDLPAKDGLARARDRNLRDASSAKEDRFEQEDIAFHERVREGYLAIAKEEPNRFAIVDARGSEEEVHKKITEAMETFLGLNSKHQMTNSK
ncbi:MAG: dTMP kinase [Pseudomonadota bacterium]